MGPDSLCARDKLDIAAMAQVWGISCVSTDSVAIPKEEEAAGLHGHGEAHRLAWKPKRLGTRTAIAS